jgi:hypothetical protein
MIELLENSPGIRPESNNYKSGKQNLARTRRG